MIFLLCILNAKAHQFSFFDNRTCLAPVLTADPEQTEFASRFVKSQAGDFYNKYYLDLGFGGDAPFFRLRDSVNMDTIDRISINVKGMIKSRFGFKTRSFDLFCTDFYGGVSIGFRTNWQNCNTFEAYLYHQSSHLGDDYIENFSGNPFNYSHEVLRLLHYLDFVKNLKIAYGLLYEVRKDTSIKGGRAGVKFDGRYDYSFWGHRIFLATDITSKEQNSWSPSFNTQAGFELSSFSTDRSRRKMIQSIVFEYYTGNSLFGQFYGKKESYFSLSIMVNF